MPSESWDIDVLQCCEHDPKLLALGAFCPCLALKEGAENISQDGVSYCLLTPCCSVAKLGKEVAKAQGIEQADVTSCATAIFCNCCYTCTVVHETRRMKEKNNQASESPAAGTMDRT